MLNEQHNVARVESSAPCRTPCLVENRNSVNVFEVTYIVHLHSPLCCLVVGLNIIFICVVISVTLIIMLAQYSYTICLLICSPWKTFRI